MDLTRHMLREVTAVFSKEGNVYVVNGYLFEEKPDTLVFNKADVSLVVGPNPKSRTGVSSYSLGINQSAEFERSGLVGLIGPNINVPYKKEQ